MGFINILVAKDVMSEISDIKNELPTQFKTLVIDGLKEDYGFYISIYAPVGETGDLVSHHVVVDTGDYAFFFDNEMMYYPFVILGTRPHSIDPLQPAYGLFWPGALHPVRHVDHPGTAPNDYMALAYDEGEATADSRLDDMGNWIAGD